RTSGVEGEGAELTKASIEGGRSGEISGLSLSLQRFGELEPFRFETRQLPGALALPRERGLERFTRVADVSVAAREPRVDRLLLGVQCVHLALKRSLPREQRLARRRTPRSRIGFGTCLRTAVVARAGVC